MLAHRVIDALRGRDPKYTIKMLPGTTREHLMNLYQGIQEATKFEFNPLLLEPVPDQPDKFRIPDLTIDEREWWINGLIPLPFSLCWYEYRLNGVWHGLLVSETIAEYNGIYGLIEIELSDDTFFVDGAVHGVDRKKATAFEPVWPHMLGGNKKGITEEDKLYGAATVHLSIYLTLMLNSKSTEHESVAAPDKLNKQRLNRGVTPLPAFRRVMIVPWSMARPERPEDGEGSDRRRPRLHWRRSHKRHYPERTPNSRWMAGEVYKGTAGWWVTIIPRMWVSKAEHGTVEQEYVVQGSPEK